MNLGDYTKDYMIQRPAIARFQELGWVVMDCFKETCGSQGTLGRETREIAILRGWWPHYFGSAEGHEYPVL